MITGGSSSAVAIAQSEECQKAGVVFMAALTHSNATTGKDAHRHTFRWYNNGHQTAKAMAQTLVDRFGKDAKYAFLYADYTWGQTVQKSMQDVIEKAGSQFESIFVDTSVMNGPATAICSMANKLIKEKWGFPCASAPSNGSYMWPA